MLFIRVDANEKVGMGHYMRCKAIADEYVKYFDDCTFITSSMLVFNLLKKEKHSAIFISGEWNNMNDEIDKMKNIIREFDIKILLIDSYYATKKYMESIGELCKTVYLGDLNTYICNLAGLINFNIYYKQFNYEKLYKDNKTCLLLGTKYTPLRAEFYDDNIYRNDTKEIVITSGGADKYNIVAKILKKLIKDNELNEYKINVVCGRLNTNRQELEILNKRHSNIKLFIDTKKIAKIMKASDIAISAGGSTLYELCACGVPTICYSFVDNQKRAVELFSKEIMIGVGDIRGREDVCINLIHKNIKYLIKNSEYRKNISKKMKTIVDKHGCRRIVNKLVDIESERL